MTVVVDTNVILVANRQHDNISAACISTCAKRLQEIMVSGRIAIDDKWLIISEYQNKTNANAGKNPGDAFVKWVLQNKSNSSKCDQVCIKEHSKRGFESFPDTADLKTFDKADRKFVAVAATHPDNPTILQAADSKWLSWNEALKKCGIKVEFVCQKDINKFHKKKNQING